MRRRFSPISQSNNFSEPVINLTPLIDVVFVILIMFIIIAPLLEMDQIELANNGQQPIDTKMQVQQTSPITIHVHANNSVLLNSKPIALNNLSEQLQIAKSAHPKAVPQLFHDKKAHFGTYQLVKNATEEAGFSQLDIILKSS